MNKKGFQISCLLGRSYSACLVDLIKIICGSVWETDAHSDRDLWFENQVKLFSTTILTHGLQCCVISYD